MVTKGGTWCISLKKMKQKESKPSLLQVLECSIDMICDEEESMLIVGRQVKNEKSGRSDLTAVDNNGNIVLIEIKRDRKDIESRKESFEF